jgi:hypothetical protein
LTLALAHKQAQYINPSPKQQWFGLSSIVGHTQNIRLQKIKQTRVYAIASNPIETIVSTRNQINTLQEKE